MTNSQSGEESSCFGLRCRRYHHSDNCVAESTPPVIPVSIRLHREAADGAAELLPAREGSCVVPVTAPLSLSLSLPLSLSICLFSSLSLSPHLSVTRALSLSPSPSLCPCALAVSSLTAGWREADARVYRGAQAPASTTRLSCSALWRGGAWRFKGTAHRAASLLRLSSPLCWRPHSPHYLLSTLPISAFVTVLSGGCACVISLLNQEEVFLCLPAKQSLGTGCPKIPGCCIINIQSRLVFDDLIWLRDRNREGGPAWLFFLLSLVLFISNFIFIFFLLNTTDSA